MVLCRFTNIISPPSLDTLTKSQRSRCMSRIRSQNTRPEIIVRKLLTELGVKYRLYGKKYPGKPDILISKKKNVLFVNGCFWHQHNHCKRKTMPKTNIEYWKAKLEQNVEKQRYDITVLKKLGWKAHVVWECQTKDIPRLRNLIIKML